MQIFFNLYSVTYRTPVLAVQIVQMLVLYARRPSVLLAYQTSNLNSSVQLQLDSSS